MKKNVIRTIIGIFLVFCLAAIALPAKANPFQQETTVPPTVPPTEPPTEAPVVATDGPAFSFSVDAVAKSGIPGSIVTYTLTIINTSSSDPLTVSLSSPASVSGWDPAPSIDKSSVNLGAGESATVLMDVPIPASATAGQNDKERITATGGGTTQNIDVTTTVKAATVPGRPVVLVATYYVNSGTIGAGSEFQLALKLINSGQNRASNIIISYDGGTSFFPKGSGGISSISGLDAGSHTTVYQSFTGAGELAWLDIAAIKVSISYSDSNGISYSDVFSLNFEIANGGSSGSVATATPVGANQPQLVITSYKVDVDLLQPGTTFNLSLDVKNMGNSDARGVTMVLGGGGTTNNSDSGTPQPGGVSGSSGELTNFAPMNSSNLVYVGDIQKGSTVTLTQHLIVNVTTEPGVYTLKTSFVYTDPKGNKIVDDQVITLLVYSLPQVEASFYRDPGIFNVGVPSVLPIQVTNLGKKTSVLGNMKVTAEGEEITNNMSLVGALDPGGYYTLDASIFPSKEGPLDIIVTINYSDDFNQPRTIVQKISIDVQPAIEFTPAPGVQGSENVPGQGSQGQAAAETFWHKVGRFIKGMIGLDSGLPAQAPSEVSPTEVPVIVGPKG